MELLVFIVATWVIGSMSDDGVSNESFESVMKNLLVGFQKVIDKIIKVKKEVF